MEVDIEARRAKDREKYAKHKAKILAKQKRYRARNKERLYLTKKSRMQAKAKARKVVKLATKLAERIKRDAPKIALSMYRDRLATDELFAIEVRDRERFEGDIGKNHFLRLGWDWEVMSRSIAAQSRVDLWQSKCHVLAESLKRAQAMRAIRGLKKESRQFECWCMFAKTQASKINHKNNKGKRASHPLFRWASWCSNKAIYIRNKERLSEVIANEKGKN